MERIDIEVAYATSVKQRIISLQVDKGTTLIEAVKQSGIADEFSEIDLDNVKLGIFSKASLNPQTQVVNAGERIEIYRPLIADPKEVRRRRAEEAERRHQQQS